MKRRLTQSIAGLLLVCMAGSTIFGAASVTRKGAPKSEPTTTASPSTEMPGKAPTKEPSKAPAMPSSPSAPSQNQVMPKAIEAPQPSQAPTTPSTTPSQPVTPVAPKPPVVKPVTPVAPSTKPSTPAAPSAKPTTKPSAPVAPKPPTTTAPSETPSTKPSTCPNKPSTCPNKKPECPNKPKPFALDNFKVIQATLASCGVDGQELAEYIKQGKKLEDVLKAENISVSKFKKRVLKEYCKVINEAVKSGQLTNEQGAQLKDAIKDTVKNWLPKK